MSNSRLLVDREHIHGTINGIDFGPRVSIIVRSPTSLLLWSAGHSWSLNGNSRYSESYGVLFDRMDGSWRCYTRIGGDGGRLTLERFEPSRAALELAFPISFEDIGEPIRKRKTLLIEGGGAALQPHHRLGREAYINWRNGVANA